MSERVMREVGLTKEIVLPVMDHPPVKVSTYALPVPNTSSEISFKKPSEAPTSTDSSVQSVETSPSASVESPVVEVEKTPAEKRSERRDTWKRASDMERKAVALQKQAQAKMGQAEQVAGWVEAAKKDPLQLAKVLGVEPQELYRLMTNQMLNIKDEEPKPTLTPEQENRARLERLEQERFQERETAAKQQVISIRQTYIKDNILPVLAKDPSKYELISQDPEEQADRVYDIMDSHYRATGGKNGGEILKVEDVLEALEEHFAKYVEASLLKIRKVSKLSKHFAPEVSVKTPLPAVQPKRRTLSNSLGASAPATSAPTKAPMDKKARLARVLAMK